MCTIQIMSGSKEIGQSEKNTFKVSLVLCGIIAFAF